MNPNEPRVDELYLIVYDENGEVEDILPGRLR